MSEEILEPTRARGVAVELPAIHIDVHVHFDRTSRDAGEAGAIGSALDREAAASGKREPAGRSLLRTAAIAAAVLLAGFLGYRAGAGSASPPSVVASTNAQAVGREGAAPSAPPTLPEALARELQTAPQITPPPGSAGPSGAPAGPSAFGLHE